jgi:hypothetical protein
MRGSQLHAKRLPLVRQAEAITNAEDRWLPAMGSKTRVPALKVCGCAPWLRRPPPERTANDGIFSGCRPARIGGVGLLSA